MLRFGFSTAVDLLSWIVALTLGAKVVATAVVLLIDRQARDRPGWGSTLWWVTKLAPVAAVPCLIAIALLQHQRDMVRLFLAAGVFIVIAVPLAVRARRRRMRRTTDIHCPSDELGSGGSVGSLTAGDAPCR